MRLKTLLLMFLIMLATSSGLYAQSYLLTTIEQIQFVLDPAANDTSFHYGDTVEVRGLVMTDPKALFVGARWACFVVDPDFPSDPWQGFFVIHDDSTIAGTNFETLEPGMICRFTGVITEFQGLTQMVLLTDPLVPVTIEAVGAILPQPIQLTTADLANPTNGEQWEGQFVQIMDAEIIDNAASSNRAVIQDISAQPTFVDDYFQFMRDRLNSGAFAWPANGTTIGVTGFVRSLSDGYSINPRNFDDLEGAIDPPPTIGTAARNFVFPTSNDDVTITTIITDNNLVSSASLRYSVDEGPWTSVTMTATDSIWSGDIPAHSPSSFVRYFVTAEDDQGNRSYLPSDTSRASGSMFRYVVRNGTIPIADIQNTHGYADDASPYLDYQVTLEGIIMSGPNHFSGYYLQDAEAAWSGILFRFTQASYQIGDFVQIHGRVQEDFGLTYINIDFDTLITAGVGPFNPLPQQTGNLRTGGSLAEAFESVFISFENVTVTNALPDLPNNFGEFIIDDGSGGMRVDDESFSYNGNLGGAISNGMVGYIQGIHSYTFSDFKLEPRDDNDVNLLLASIDEDPAIPLQFSLKQNYPNPFNPVTNVEFELPAAAVVTLEIYDIIGRRVETPYRASLQPAGMHKFVWNATDAAGNPVVSGVYFYRLTAGDFVETRKMLLIR